MGFRRIYADRDGNLYADNQPVYGKGAIMYEDDEYGYEDEDNFFGDEDFGDEYEYDDFGDDYFEDDDDDFGDEDEDDFGRRRRRRRSRRRSRRSGRRKPSGRRQAVQKTVVSGSATLSGAGNFSITITPQHAFEAQDFTMAGTTGGATVTSIFFGDNLIWQSNTGVPEDVFAANGYLRDVVKGAKLLPGLSIVVNGALAGAGTAYASFTGTKPAKTC